MALELLKDESAFKAISSPKERTELYDDFIANVRRQEQENSRLRKKRASEKFQKLLLSMRDTIRVDTPWKMAIGLFSTSEKFKTDEDLGSMEPLDLLVGYEEYIKFLELEMQNSQQEQREKQRRQERLNRKAFRELLHELESSGKLKATTSWMELHPAIKQRPELVAILSQPGSTPLDLFWDHLHAMQEKYVNDVKKAIEKLEGCFGPKWLSKITVAELEAIANDLSIPTLSVKAAEKHVHLHARLLMVNF